MECIACNGTGRIRKYRKADKVCYDCKGTGEAANLEGNHVWYNGSAYGVGDVLFYRNTKKKKCLVKITGLELSMAFMKNTDNYPVYHYPLKDVLFTGNDTVTGAFVCRPLWRSIPLKRKHEFFETLIVDRK